jgi:hypothetical protein
MLEPSIAEMGTTLSGDRQGAKPILDESQCFMICFVTALSDFPVSLCDERPSRFPALDREPSWFFQNHQCLDVPGGWYGQPAGASRPSRKQVEPAAAVDLGELLDDGCLGIGNHGKTTRAGFSHVWVGLGKSLLGRRLAFISIGMREQSLSEGAGWHSGGGRDFLPQSLVMFFDFHTYP